jgi:hypothetical protein
MEKTIVKKQGGFLTHSTKDAGRKEKKADRKRKKARKKKEKWEWQAVHYRQVLEELAYEAPWTDGDGSIIIVIKPGMSEGRHVMLAQMFGYEKPIDKPLLRHVKEVLEKDDSWEIWDIFEDGDDKNE